MKIIEGFAVVIVWLLFIYNILGACLAGYYLIQVFRLRKIESPRLRAIIYLTALSIMFKYPILLCHYVNEILEEEIA